MTVVKRDANNISSKTKQNHETAVKAALATLAEIRLELSAQQKELTILRARCLHKHTIVMTCVDSGSCEYGIHLDVSRLRYECAGLHEKATRSLFRLDAIVSNGDQAVRMNRKNLSIGFNTLADAAEELAGDTSALVALIEPIHKRCHKSPPHDNSINDETAVIPTADSQEKGRVSPKIEYNCDFERAEMKDLECNAANGRECCLQTEETVGDGKEHDIADHGIEMEFDVHGTCKPPHPTSGNPLVVKAQAAGQSGFCAKISMPVHVDFNQLQCSSIPPTSSHPGIITVSFPPHTQRTTALVCFPATADMNRARIRIRNRTLSIEAPHRRTLTPASRILKATNLSMTDAHLDPWSLGSSFSLSSLL